MRSGGDINCDIKVLHGYRKFCNKIYQATKYVLGKLDPDFVPPPKATKSGKESLAERWILHKFTTAVRDINKALTDREFSAATSIAYQYWYNHLCDVYIENSKFLISEGTPEEKQSATATLYNALEGGLTLIHPFMPFLTEELWQRLPRRPGDENPSIMTAAYPNYDSELDDPASEEAYELVLSVSKAIRSLMSGYAIKDSGVLYIQLFDETAYKTCQEQLQSIRSLSGKGVADISLLKGADNKPAGCVPSAVSSAATVFLVVKGRVDIDNEIEKAQKKLEKAAEAVKKQKKILSDEAYKTKVSKELQEVEQRKLEDAEAEVREMEISMQQFQALKLEE